MPAPKIYKYNDANAPVLSGTRGSLINVISKCLIDGYGTMTPPGGWTMPYISGDLKKAVFRNDPVTGRGFFLRVNELTSASANIPSFLAYEIMTDIDTGVGTFRVAPEPSPISATADATGRPWIVLATPTAFYLFVFKSITTAVVIANTAGIDGIFFGDIKPVYPDDAYGCCLALLMDSSGYPGFGALANPSYLTTNMANSHINLPRPLSAILTPTVAVMCPGGGPSGSGTNGATACSLTSMTTLYVVGKRFFIHRPHISDITNNSIRGWLPGMYMTCHQIHFSQFEAVAESGKSLMSISGWMAGYSSAPAALLFDVTADTW